MRKKTSQKIERKVASRRSKIPIGKKVNLSRLNRRIFLGFNL